MAAKMWQKIEFWAHVLKNRSNSACNMSFPKDLRVMQSIYAKFNYVRKSNMAQIQDGAQNEAKMDILAKSS